MLQVARCLRGKSDSLRSWYSVGVLHRKSVKCGLEFNYNIASLTLRSVLRIHMGL